MMEALIGAGAALAIALGAGGYKLGLAIGRKNGNGNGKIDLSQYTTKEMSLLRHKSIDDALTKIEGHTESIPGIMAWIELQKKKEQ